MKRKRILLFLVFVIVIGGELFAQEGGTDGIINLISGERYDVRATTSRRNVRRIDNWISGEVGFFNAGVRYERMLNSQFSIGAEAYWNSFIFFWNDLGIIAAARFYPNEIFFLELGLGYNYHTGDIEWKYEAYDLRTDKNKTDTMTVWGATSGVCISPGLGFKIDPGKAGGFFVSPGIKVPVTIGSQKPVAWSWAGLPGESEIGVGVGIMIYCGLGYAF